MCTVTASDHAMTACTVAASHHDASAYGKVMISVVVEQQHTHSTWSTNSQRGVHAAGVKGVWGTAPGNIRASGPYVGIRA